MTQIDLGLAPSTGSTFDIAYTALPNTPYTEQTWPNPTVTGTYEGPWCPPWTHDADGTNFRRLSAGNLAPGSDPSVLPGPVLIADRDNNRLISQLISAALPLVPLASAWCTIAFARLAVARRASPLDDMEDRLAPSRR
jgi:hypothetical protein